MSKRWLITGGLGVVGSSVARQAIAQGDTVRIVDSGTDPRHEWTERRLSELGGITVRQHAIEDVPPGTLREWLQESDVVLHAAAFTGIPQSAIDPFGDWKGNVGSTMALLRAQMQLSKPVPMVVLSSVKPYALHQLAFSVQKDFGTLGIPLGQSGFYGVDENYPCEPDEPYAASKLAQSGMCLAYARTYDLPIVVFRCSNLYGPGACHGPRHGWLTWFCICAALEWPIELQGSGIQTRDMLYTTDVYSAVTMALSQMRALKGQVFNLGGGQDNLISVRRAIDLISQCTELVVHEAPGRAHEDLIFITNFEKFFGATGWFPKVHVAAGIETIYSWARAHRDELKQIYAQFAPKSQ